MIMDMLQCYLLTEFVIEVLSLYKTHAIIGNLHDS
jgi:hypothetical protein